MYYISFIKATDYYEQLKEGRFNLVNKYFKQTEVVEAIFFYYMYMKVVMIMGSIEVCKQKSVQRANQERTESENTLVNNRFSS